MTSAWSPVEAKHNALLCVLMCSLKMDGDLSLPSIIHLILCGYGWRGSKNAFAIFTTMSETSPYIFLCIKKCTTLGANIVLIVTLLFGITHIFWYYLYKSFFDIEQWLVSDLSSLSVVGNPHRDIFVKLAMQLHTFLKELLPSIVNP